MLPSIRFLVVVFHLLLVGFVCFAASNSSLGCMKGERQALLKFKDGLKDPSNRLSSWVGEDCCTWAGVYCHNKTGHVVKLNLEHTYQWPSRKRGAQLIVTGDLGAYVMRSCLSGEINPSLLELKYLNRLDLSNNCFGGINIPKFIGSLNKLRSLHLSRAGFAGRVPSELGNLSALHHLNLNNDVRFWMPDYDLDVPFYDLHVDRLDMPYYDLHVDRLDWLSRLSSLRHLDMGRINLSMATDWLLSINMLPSVQELTLNNCSLRAIPTSLVYVNFSMLSSLDISYNYMLGPAIPTWLFNLSKIENLYLDHNNFRDSISTALGNLCHLRTISLRSNSLGGDIRRFEEGFSGCINKSLEELYLSSNGLCGNLPNWLWRFTNLKSLSLSHNYLSGPIPTSLGNMSFLRKLHLHDNLLNGTISESLGKLSNLESLRLRNNSFKGVLTEAHFFNSKSLTSLSLSSNSLLVLKVSSNWVPPFQLQYFSADGCKLGPKFPSWLQTQNKLAGLSLSNTGISDTIPDFLWNLSSNIYFIDLSNNLISGSITKSFGETTNLIYLSLSSNRLTGNIPLSICKIPLTILDLSYNQLTNEIPSCIGDLQYLTALVLRNNNLSEDIPTSIGHLSWLQSLHLSLNKLSGELPPSLKSCQKLITLDLAKNGLTGKIPTWIGERMSLLQHLIMRSNKFEGSIPLQLSLLSKLQVLDLADNNLSGTIPPSFSNFSAMTVANKKKEFILLGQLGDLESIWVFWKGNQYEYNNTLSLMMAIDLSSNNLSGEIREDITCLFGLRSLNLSKNNFTGLIPKTIGQLRWVESLDLSFNQFTGVIPPSFSTLTSLSHLNLSHNNLSGKIPSSNQLNTLTDPSIYMENPLLCGPPLSKQCPGDEMSQDDLQPFVIGDGEDRNWSEMQLFYLSMGGGFVVGFFIVWCILLFKRSWRIAYFRFFDDMRDKLYVAIARKKCLALRMKMCIGTH